MSSIEFIFHASHSANGSGEMEFTWNLSANVLECSRMFAASISLARNLQTNSLPIFHSFKTILYIIQSYSNICHDAVIFSNLKQHFISPDFDLKPHCSFMRLRHAFDDRAAMHWVKNVSDQGIAVYLDASSFLAAFNIG